MLAGSRSHQDGRDILDRVAFVIPRCSFEKLSRSLAQLRRTIGATRASRAKVTSVVLIERPTDVCLTRRWRARVNGLTLKRKLGDDRIREAVLGGAFSAAGEKRGRDTPETPREYHAKQRNR